MFGRAKIAELTQTVQGLLAEMGRMQLQLRVFESSWQFSCELMHMKDKRISEMKAEIDALRAQLDARDRAHRVPAPSPMDREIAEVDTIDLRPTSHDHDTALLRAPRPR